MTEASTLEYEPRQQKILVVDDERFNINVMVDLLKKDYRMAVAKNGQQALKVATSSSPPDLILLDIIMPDMDGYEVCRQLKADPRSCDIPVIFVTAMGQDEDETLGLQLGAVDYLTKPIKPAIVRARVQTQLKLKQNIEKLQDAYDTIEAQKNRMQSELNVGRHIQMSMVPKVFPEVANCQIHAIVEPAREVGGDFYDAFFINDQHICICIGDVAGKGVPAALFMAMTKTLIKSRATTDASTASIIEHVNEELSRDNDNCLFVTVFLAIVDVQTGMMTCTNAGHNPPLIKHANNQITVLSTLNGPVVAAMQGQTFTQQQIQLQQDDLLLLFTDGVVEADNPEGIFFGNQRLHDAFINFSGSSVRRLTKDIVNLTHEFEGPNRQADDITVLAMHFQQLAVDLQLALTIVNQRSEIERVNDQFMQIAGQRGLPDKVSASVCMAIDDLLANIMAYAFDDEKPHQIDLQFTLNSVQLSLSIRDDGKAFDPFNQSQPDLALDVDQRQVGGLGIMLVSQMFDQYDYQRIDDHNLVTLVKKFG